MTSPVATDPTLMAANARFHAGDDAAAVALLSQHLDQPACAVRLREWAVAERRLDLLPAAQARLEAGSAPEADVSRAVSAQLWGNTSGALALLKPVLGAHPECATAHHHAGRALHNLGRRAEALAALRLAVQLEPDYAEAWYSLAHALRATGRMEESVAAYRAALQRMPSLRAALLNLGITLNAMDRADEALLPLERLLGIDPDHVEAWVNKGLCLHVLGRAGESHQCYQQALQRDPEHPQAHFYLGCLLNEQMAVDDARTHLTTALRVGGPDPDVLAELAGLSEQNNELQPAEEYVAQGLEVAPDHPGLVIEAARLDRRLGRLETATGRLASLDPARLSSRAAQQFWYERAMVDDRAGRSAQAMQAITRAHELAARNPRRRDIDREAFPRRIESLEQWLRSGAPGARSASTDPAWEGAFRPAFLVGFPRSGTTLLDTMLDAHPQVASIEERPTIEHVLEGLFGTGSGYPQGMASLSPDDIARAHALYAAAVRHWLPQSGEFSGLLLDKLPLRLLHVPLIRRLFPQAPILFAARHPCDVVLSNVMQLYRPNDAFVHFDTIQSAAQTYSKVMRVWRASIGALSISTHTVRYEDLVDSPEIVLRKACAALDIGFEPAMLDTSERLEGRGRVRTNSYQQVAEPVYTRSVERWQRYRQWLEPVLPLLEPHIAWLGYPRTGEA